MPFNTALSGLKAASADLKVTGNNIANASTTGFKESRVEFGDVYAENILGTGSTLTGSGVKLQKVNQQFEQGSMTFTSNSLDVAIDGEGFFIIENQGARAYTRAGIFGLDKDGYVTTNTGARVQGFVANDQGTISSILEDIYIETGNLPPQPTTLVETQLNLDAQAPVLAQYGTQLSTQGLEIGQVQGGIAVGTASVVNTGAAPTPFDFSINTSTNISAANPLTPFDFSVNDPSRVTASAPVTGFDFSINDPSSITATQAPIYNIDFTGAPTGSFDITVAGGTQNGTATINLTDDIQSFQALITNIRSQLQLAVPLIGVNVREDPANPGRLQIYSTDDGVATAVTVDNYLAGGGAVVADITNLLRITDGATNAVPGAAATGVTGSLTASTFDVTIAGGSGIGGDETATLTLDQNLANGDAAALVASLNTQLDAVASPPGIDLRVREDPVNPGLIQFYATTLGEASTVTIDNYTLSPNVTGDTVTTLPDVAAALGGIADGANDNSGMDTAVSFEVNLAGGSNGLANTTATIVLDTNITTLQGLITDIRDDLSASAIGIDVREDPTNIGRLQFYHSVSGEASSITIDPNATLAASLGTVTQANVENALGGVSMGATNVIPDPTALTGATGEVGNITSASFDITLSGASQDNGGPITITLDNNIQTLPELIADIQDELMLTNVGVDVREDPDNAGRLQFYATASGEASTITINNLNTSNVGVSAADLTNTLNIATGVTVAGIPAVTNGYGSQQVDIVDSSGLVPVTTTVTTLADESAQQVAVRFNNVAGVTASASTTATVTAAGYSNTSGNLITTINGVAMTSDNLAGLMDEVNNTTSFAGISAALSSPGGDLVLTSAAGEDLTFSIASTDSTDTITVLGTQGAVQSLALTGGNVAANVGGTVALILNEGIDITNALPDRTGLFGQLTSANFTDYVVNSFQPLDQETYNSATSVTIFDSQGNSHVLTEYYVKEPYRSDVPGSTQNSWSLYVQINGLDVGDPDPTLAPPYNTAPTLAQFTLRFDETGQLDQAASDTVHITNWEPRDEDGQLTGALGPQNIIEGATLPISDPPISSNFVVDIGESTQFGSVFSVNSVDQNGFTTGQLNGMGVAANGTLTARYTNGENQILGQLALANFASTQGLKPIGNTAWIQSYESGEPVVGTPRSASLGAISSGALEDSNVELSEQLVQLIIAQRNFQASAKTIQTADAVTQTIINLR